MKLKKVKLLQKIAVIGWTSFLMACAGSMYFFAIFDPVSLSQITTWEIQLTEIEGYSIGFLLFWVLTASSSGLTSLLLVTLEPLKKDEFLEEESLEKTVHQEEHHR